MKSIMLVNGTAVQMILWYISLTLFTGLFCGLHPDSLRRQVVFIRLVYLSIGSHLITFNPIGQFLPNLREI